MKLISTNKIFAGEQRVYEHESQINQCSMRFAVYLPENTQSENIALPVLFWLSGLTCTEQNFITKSGFQRYASEHGFIVVAPDTSPRGDNVPDDANSYDFGKGAGFYLDATRQPWRKNYQMASYIVEELTGLVKENFPVDEKRMGIFGHSMGGHGAISLHLNNPEIFKSVSAFSPIVAPMSVPWGQKVFKGYLGDDQTAWANYDSCKLVEKHASDALILIDQGGADEFLEDQLKPELFEQACLQSGQALRLRKQKGYDHSYYFIASFIGEHFSHHKKELGGAI